MWSNFLNLFHYNCFKEAIFKQELFPENLAENILVINKTLGTETFIEPVHVEDASPLRNLYIYTGL